MHAISASAREKIEAAGGTVELLREPKVKKKKHHAAAKPEAAAETAAEADAPEAARGRARGDGHRRGSTAADE